MGKIVGKQHDVQSSNLKSIGFYPRKETSGEDIIRIEFQRGAAYDYWPSTNKEFQEAFAPEVMIKDWFAKVKIGKQFKKV